MLNCTPLWLSNFAGFIQWPIMQIVQSRFSQPFQRLTLIFILPTLWPRPHCPSLSHCWSIARKPSSRPSFVSETRTSRSDSMRIALRSSGSLPFTTIRRIASFRESSSSFPLHSGSGIKLVNIMFSSLTRSSIGWFFVGGIYTEASLCECPVLVFLSRIEHLTTSTSEYQSMSHLP